MGSCSLRCNPSLSFLSLLGLPALAGLSARGQPVSCFLHVTLWNRGGHGGLWGAGGGGAGRVLARDLAKNKSIIWTYKLIFASCNNEMQAFKDQVSLLIAFLPAMTQAFRYYCVDLPPEIHGFESCYSAWASATCCKGWKSMSPHLRCFHGPGWHGANITSGHRLGRDSFTWPYLRVKRLWRGLQFCD